MAPVTSELSQQILASPIMIVDDIKINRIFLEKTLRACGFKNMLCVASAEEAFAKIHAFQPDLVLLDILMPQGMDGFECCDTLRRQEEFRDLPILIETSIIEPELRVKAFKMGATDFVSKPIDADELCSRVIVHLEKRHSLKTLQDYRTRIQGELESARQLQLGLLPEQDKIDECKRLCGLTFSSAFETAPEIGGDFWGLQNLFPHQTALWLVDFSGHGMPAALNAFRLHTYLKEPIPEAARPGEYLSKLNDKLLNILPRGQFAAMFYGIVDTQSGQLFFSRANIPNPIVLHRATGKAEKLDRDLPTSKRGRFGVGSESLVSNDKRERDLSITDSVTKDRALDGSAPPLGIGMHLYSTQTIPFAASDVLLLYSDALIETPDAKGDFIAEEQLVELAEKNSDLSVTELTEIFLRTFKEHTNGVLRDDLTVVVCGQDKIP
jgi:phosphoserine phosphatase RsbU/P